MTQLTRKVDTSFKFGTRNILHDITSSHKYIIFEFKSLLFIYNLLYFFNFSSTLVVAKALSSAAMSKSDFYLRNIQ